jgi:hypothetical protein
MTDYFAVSDSYSIDFPIIDISCIILPYDVSFLSSDISCNEIPFDLSCNSEIWFSLDVSFILMDISNPNFISMDVSYGLEKNRMVFFSHELH